MLLKLQLVEALQLNLILDIHLSQEASYSFSLGRFKLKALLSFYIAFTVGFVRSKS
jgi:hypothetical protein